MPKIIDLSLTLKTGMRGVELEQKYTVEDKGWNAKTLHLYSHCGTHVDAPIHYNTNELTVDRIPLEQCISKAWIMDIPDVRPKMLVTTEFLGDLEDNVQPGESLLIRTGWSTKVGTNDYREALPRVSQHLAEWCASRQLAMLGVETPAVADPLNIPEVTLIHNILLGANILIIEGLANLDKITQKSVTLIALPLKIENGDGSPVRAIALEE